MERDNINDLMTSVEVEEIKRHFVVVAEGIEKKIQLVAEAVAELNEKVERELGSLREETNRGFVETQSMIKFSYAELDRRVTTLESSFSRMERLEARIQKLEAR